MNNVLVIGDSCKDVYISGSVDRISPEAPVPVFRQLKVTENDGMVLNVLKNLSAFDINVTCFTQNERITKTRFIDIKSNQHLIRLDEEPKYITPLDLKDINPDNYSSLIISDYNKGFLTFDICEELCRLFKGKDIFVDSKKKNLSCFKNCIIKINDLETENAFNIDDSNIVITTLGSKGAKFKNRVFKSKKVDVFDVCGAGDVFLASLYYHYSIDNDIEIAINFANLCAGLSVTKPGVYVLTKKDIEKIKAH